MSIPCDIILQWNATPGQRTALGAGLWRWCNGAAGDTGIYQFLDNQALADLIAGNWPATAQTVGPAERRGVHIRVRDETSPDREAAVASLRRELPADGIEDILVDGTSWNRPG